MTEMWNQRQYFRQVSRYLDCPGAQKRRFLSEARRKAESFQRENPDAPAEAVAEFMGEPRELALSFMEDLDPETQVTHRMRKKWLHRVLVLAGVVCIVLGLLYCWVLEQRTRVPITERETLIIYTNEGENKK